ncbi:glutamate 5-kinase [Candidatus Magnetominusculus dajiuhuensis]|uniref:glutamate 5-kinase n=1 Tax=Candidatus Magnetominusculus dajiuhuensis TaxID=3137712 RepID=UPI003B42D775
METIVIKIGSSIITTPEGLNEAVINHLARDISALCDIGHQTIIVSSGAVAAGRGKLGIEGPINDINIKQAAAAAGQSSLVWAYERAFGLYNKKVAQVLLTRDVFSIRQRYLNARNTLRILLDFHIIPIINENDTVSIDELKFGDNDRLAALVASLLNADRLVILSDVNGLYNFDPRKNKSAKLIPVVKIITPEMEKAACGSATECGTGGMSSKLVAAKMASADGITVNIVNGNSDYVLSTIFYGSQPGTLFEPTARKHGARKGWIAFGIRSKGRLTLDDGAATAIISGGKSLLPSGIKSISGVFDRGDAVYCVNSTGKQIAKGLVNYDNAELIKIIGHKTSQIEAILGFKYSDEVIHRDNMTIL